MTQNDEQVVLLFVFTNCG